MGASTHDTPFASRTIPASLCTPLLVRACNPPGCARSTSSQAAGGPQQSSSSHDGCNNNGSRSSSASPSSPIWGDAQWAFSYHAPSTLQDRLLSSLNCSSSNSSHGQQPTPPPLHARLHRWRNGITSSSSSSTRRHSFASLSTGSQIGQQQPPQQPQPQQQRQAGIPKEQLERDLARLAQDVFKAGDMLAGGRYKLLEKVPATLGLADGRFTTVWRGRDAVTDSDVILKCVEGGDAASYSSGTREAALHAAAGRHPNIVPLLDAFEHRSGAGRHAVMVLEPSGTNLQLVLEQYVGGVNLGDKQQPALHAGICSSPRTLKHIARHTLAALDHLHKRGLAHMDLAPDNLLIDRPFKPMFEVHREALFPHGNPLKAAQSWWRLLSPWGRSSSEQQLSHDMDAALAKADQEVRHEGSLHAARIRLTDFGRAVPFEQLNQQQAAAAAAAAAGAAAQPHQEDGGHKTAPGSGNSSSSSSRGLLQHNRDGLVVFGDPLWRPPEEVLAMEYAGPGYDMWRLGCLLYTLATTEQLFDITDLQRTRDASASVASSSVSSSSTSKARAVAPQHKPGSLGKCSDGELLLFAMTQVLGPFPREFVRRSPLFRDLFIDKAPSCKGSTDPLLRITNALLSRPGSASIEAQLQQHTAMDDASVAGFAAFLQPLMVYDPARRPSAAEMLQHRWLQTDLSDAADDDNEPHA